MNPKVILFDLDGTLTDSGEGIIKCYHMTLTRLGLPIPNDETMRSLIGPPLCDGLIKCGVPADTVDEAIRIYRSRYTTVGKFENAPYPGIREMLQQLRELGHRLFVATSKPEATAREILAHFQLDSYFELICGAARDGVRGTKAEVIAYLLEQIGHPENIVMVGDTSFDVAGAAAHNIPTIGVSWGFGTVASMKEAGAVAIVDNVSELIDLMK